MGRLLHSTEAGVRRWEIRPNCSLTPAQTLGCYAGVCLPCSALALVFGWLGYPLIAGFVLLELLGLGGALLVHTRHAVDHETLTLDGEGLEVEILRGETLTRLHLQPRWVRVRQCRRPAGLVELSQSGRRVLVGRHLNEAARRELAAELRSAIG